MMTNDEHQKHEDYGENEGKHLNTYTKNKNNVQTYRKQLHNIIGYTMHKHVNKHSTTVEQTNFRNVVG